MSNINLDTDPERNPDNPESQHAPELAKPDDVSHLSFAEIAAQGHGATRLDPNAPAVLSVDDLKMYFPVKSSGVVRRTIGRWVNQSLRRRPMIVPLVIEA